VPAPSGPSRCKAAHGQRQASGRCSTPCRPLEEGIPPGQSIQQGVRSLSFRARQLNQTVTGDRPTEKKTVRNAYGIRMGKCFMVRRIKLLAKLHANSISDGRSCE
jgi:hypothetical protein